MLMYDVTLHEFRGESEVVVQGGEAVIALATTENLGITIAGARDVRGLIL